ncbi:tropomyosin [Bergeyella zoohelcum]|uniref:Uncharacterized protein n=1 Tax=Bergeyella zoohelcum ATCC 43767 TaxID=883096 RepID=K1M003_9FLAO|nr:hypothetical protein [Bergeyella zoohelcum]EKB57622.1 hypothetical protein HMPREF9699_01108 [Bergeyella zoohelcum ATCC 43767]SUV48708.1 Uncharacterised protein [Bergeyella zoohelcum]
MNKTTVKISVLAFLGFMTYGYAQQQQQDPYKGKVGVNTIEPSATMDIRPSTANAQKEATTNEGIIAPKLSKTRIANIATPVEGTLVYATDDATSLISAYTGNDPKVAKITEKGYYFYNGTEWVKAGSDINSGEWVYDPVTKRINLKRSGNDPFKNLVYYTEKGSHRDIDEPTLITKYFDSKNLQEVDSVLPTENYLFSKKYNRVFGSTIEVPADIVAGVWGNIPANTYTNETFLNEVPDKATDITNTTSILYVPSTLNGLKQLKSITGGGNFVGYHAPEKLDNIWGQQVEALLGMNASADNVYGSRNRLLTYSSKPIKNLRGGEVYTYIRGNGKIANVFANTFNVHIQNGSTSEIDNIVGGAVFFRNFHNSAPVIKKIRGFLIDGFRAVSGATIPTITENIGLFIQSIEGGTSINRAIHTEAGQIRFGDLKHSVSTNVASTGDRPVFVTADGVLKVGNASTALSRAVWKTDGNHVKLAVKADGTDRTDNIITINDEGQMFASSFKGTNGATIFPDYVFQKYYTGTSSIKADYNFKSLSQVEDFVKTNGHLPGYKSAATIKAQGYVDLMETQLTNVEKIEELYLHLMEKEKEVKELRNKNQELENRLERLEKLLK